MSGEWKAMVRPLTVMASVALGVAACEQGPPTGPESSGGPALRGPLAAVGPTAYPGVKVPGQVQVCKDAQSPAGTYTFHVEASPQASGDQMVSSVNLTPGTCAVVWERTAPSGPVTRVTVTEIIPDGADYQLDHINANDDAKGSRDVPGPSETVEVKGEHGAVLTFFNVARNQTVDASHVVVCKSSNSPAGTYTFNVNAVGTIASDVVTSTVNLSAGGCDTVFVRVESGPVAATITIVEDLEANANVFLQNVTVDGETTATVGGGVVVQQNVGPDRVVVFFNAQATVGGSVTYHPTSQTPGVIHLCKAGSVPGTFNFTVNAVGTVATDQVVSNVSLTSETCKVIFIRTVPQAVSATITVTEVIESGSLFVLDRILRIDASGTLEIKGSAAVVVTENASPDGGSLLVFFNTAIALP